MQLYTFKARSLSEALRVVRDELGPDASVLHTREIGSTLGKLLGTAAIEVTASVELEAPSRFPAEDLQRRDAITVPQRIPAAELLDFRRVFRQNLAADGNKTAETSLVERLASREKEREIGDVGQGMPRRVGRTGQAPGNYLPARGEFSARLLRIGVSEATAQRWLDRLAAELMCDPECHAERMWDRLCQIVASELPVCGPLRSIDGQRLVIALVGPTGVGKTTTLAKLAAHFRLHERRSVALVTIDTYRIAAAEQLQAYAQIMDLPMEVVANGEGMRAAIQRFGEQDILFIDTGGTSPRDLQRLGELQQLLAPAQPHATTLVLSCAAEAASVQPAVEAFAELGATSLILTKFDEAAKLGGLADALAECPLAVSYLTSGQNVPADIEPASAQRLAELILEPSEMARSQDSEKAKQREDGEDYG